MGTWSLGHWLIVLLIVIVLFGTKKLKSIGKDAGEAIKEYKKALNEDREKLEKEFNDRKNKELDSKLQKRE